ncbi:hypothetical protein ACIRPH_20425 [Nocardiopsis sp. NPDC101807]|uniref:hypothetical protein n=1 Tax=Nocardiopsis sp. NPDC101807 TaxID=3364339 RepID=UPI00381F6F51
MDGQTGSGGIRRTAGSALPRRAPGVSPPARPGERRPSPGGSLLTTVLLPVLPAVLLLAATSVALSVHGLLPPSPGAAPPLPPPAEPSTGLVVLAGLTLASLAVGLPVSVHAGLLVGGGAVLGQDVGARAAWSRALRRVPGTLALLLPLAASWAGPLWGLRRLASEGAWSAPAAAATAAGTAVAVLLLAALPLRVLADLSPGRALAETWRTARARSTARAAARIRAALPRPRPGDAHGIPAAVPALVCVLALLPLAAPGLLRPEPAPPGSAPSAALTASAENRTTVQIEDEDGTAHLFEVGPGGLREADCGPGCTVGPAEPGPGAHVDADGSHARVGGRVVAAYWRTDPDHGPSTLYLRVCDTGSPCPDDAEAAAAPASAPPAGSRVEVLRDGGARVLGCTEPCAAGAVDRAGEAPGPERATAVRPAHRAGAVTVEVSGPETLRLVMLACDPSGSSTDCGAGV